MFYLLYGKDTFRSKRKLKTLLDFFSSKTDRMGVFRISGEDFNSFELEELLQSQILFRKKHLVVCEAMMENKNSSKFVSENITKFFLSHNVFIFWEKEINSEDLKLFEEKAEKIQSFNVLSGHEMRKWIMEEIRKSGVKSVSQEEQENIINICGFDLWCASREIEKYVLGGKIEFWGTKNDYNPFHICDAFVAKNKNKTWVLFQQALLRGVAAEDVFWKIWWQVKNLLLIKKLSESNVKNLRKESGLHPFVVKKTLTALKNFTGKELNGYSSQLVNLYHDIRKGRAEFEIGLEKFLINF
ncbi:MAG TPA: hypothetical protein ENH22_00105 [Candidatus Campbellbacteria bacterium]|nr:hypothetical protein [Candidatus Campbellbacteria bacterium]